MALTLPAPRVPFDDGSARWYKNELGWAAAEGPPVRLITGLRFDVLGLPADAGTALLRHGVRTGPVARAGDGVLLLVAAGTAEDLPALLDWLEWGGIGLELSALGRGGSVPAPSPPGRAVPAGAPPGAAVWLRPPEPGRAVEPSLPAFGAAGRAGAGTGDDGGAPDLVRLVDAAANACHRARLMRACAAGPHTRAQPLAFS
ncbi:MULTISPECIES: SCO3374 family protein [unclassified Streptomyces]|uniref:SCO3374 family protein n=1 Tax=unclassified Streptomyces TaxID=2593676 RepID=UPI000F45EBF2|nr:SCO3374 family protein [Streptomyces sp. I6]RNL72199.1 hypothetical protein EBF04_16745 [Streptomyces sp. I6]